jgi:hypothetical protein
VTFSGEVLELLRQRPDWHDGIATIRRLHEAAGEQARADAEAYGAVYEGRRAPMVFDVVASRRRSYPKRVLPLVAQFSETPASASLEALAADGPGKGWGLRTTEPETIRLVAAGLLRFAGDHDCDGDDVTVRLWADRTLPVVDAHDLDPYVGSVSGIGLALFAYMRMRSGGDGLKPDIRVRRGLTKAGFHVPRSDLAMLRLAEAVAAEADVPLLVLDQLLWQNT